MSGLWGRYFFRNLTKTSLNDLLKNGGFVVKSFAFSITGLSEILCHTTDTNSEEVIRTHAGPVRIGQLTSMVTIANAHISDAFETSVPEESVVNSSYAIHW